MGALKHGEVLGVECLVGAAQPSDPQGKPGGLRSSENCRADLFLACEPGECEASAREAME